MPSIYGKSPASVEAQEGPSLSYDRGISPKEFQELLEAIPWLKDLDEFRAYARNLIDNHGWTQERLAKRLGWEQSTLSRVLAGDRPLSPVLKKRAYDLEQARGLAKDKLELAYLHLLLSGYHIGVDNPLRQKDAAAMLGVDPRQIRKAKRALRRSGMAICERTWGKKRGDFIAATPEEWKQHFERPFRGRALDILITYRRGLEEAKKKFGEVVPMDGILAHVKQVEAALQDVTE